MKTHRRTHAFPPLKRAACLCWYDHSGSASTVSLESLPSSRTTILRRGGRCLQACGGSTASFLSPSRGRPVDVQSSGLCSRNESDAAAPGNVFLAQLCDGFLYLPTTLA